MSDRKDIGGLLGMAEYAALAQIHRPAEPGALAEEIRRLHQTGLTPRDIAVALRLALDAVVNIIGVAG